MIITYDVLGHLPKPREWLAPELCHQIARRERNGILFSSPGDLVVLASEPDSGHLTWLREVGFAGGELYPLPPAKDCRMSSLEALLSNPSQLEKLRHQAEQAGIQQLFTWMNTENEIHLASALGLKLNWKSSLEILDSQADKKNFKRRLAHLGLPLIAGFEWRMDSEARGENYSKSSKQKTALAYFIDLCRSINVSGNLIARPANSASGMGIFVFSQLELESAFARIASSNLTSWLVEDYFENCRSLNFQLVIAGRNDFLFLGLSHQLLKNQIHIGNESSQIPPEDLRIRECHRQGNLIAQDLATQGYRGLIGLDFILTQDHQVFCIENNIRLNGSTFSLALVAQLERELACKLHWSFEKVSCCKKMDFGELLSVLDGLMYQKDLTGFPKVFVQEFNSDELETQLALIYIGKTSVQWQQIRKEVQNRLGLDQEVNSEV